MIVVADKSCPICNNEAPYRLTKGATSYHQCGNCKTLFCDELSQEGLVGGEHEIGRNELQNHIRIGRVDEMIYGSKKEDVNILDFGCGSGMLVRDLIVAGYPNVTGYDAYNDEFNKSLPKRNSFHICTMIECVEHLASPYLEIDVIFRALLPGGGFMVESGYIDVAAEDGIAIEDYLYVNPKAGHSTIFSHHGLDVLMCKKGFVPRQHWNRNVRLFQKPMK